jgi:hypothetical protein
VVVAWVATTGAARPEPAVRDQVADRFVPAPIERQRIEGLLGQKMAFTAERRLLAVEEDVLLAGFRRRPGPHPWIGEHAGKFLDAAALAWL